VRSWASIHFDNCVWVLRGLPRKPFCGRPIGIIIPPLANARQCPHDTAAVDSARFANLFSGSSKLMIIVVVMPVGSVGKPARSRPGGRLIGGRRLVQAPVGKPKAAEGLSKVDVGSSGRARSTGPAVLLNFNGARPRAVHSDRQARHCPQALVQPGGIAQNAREARLRLRTGLPCGQTRLS
jgi:hypothetical protein